MAEATQRRTAAARPLSPHLQIYSPKINMVMSIVHRITGAALYVGTLLLAWWLIAAATGPAYYAFVSQIMGHPIGLAILAGYTWALIHHALGGVRHFVWDLGYGFNLVTVDTMCWLSLFASLGGTAAIWYVVLGARGII
ncbi:MAG: succinate dehydrogenase, cytochrome b556 subunit [Hyphomicrobiaceae bacterium]|jgi:succinate dehydrogenase / fumarate reductase cytochrome b subunit